MKRLHFFGLLVFLALTLQAQIPTGYYTSANGKHGAALKSALYDIISKNVTVRTYTQVWTDFTITDVRSDGKIRDRYAQTNYTPVTNQGSTGSTIGDGYNREHSMPKSWFYERSPMYTDLMHLIPADCYVNTRRNNYPFGTTTGNNYDNGYTKLGTSTVNGYSGIVFEPADEYKGDFARIYFYMVTRNENEVATWSSPMLAGNKYPALSTWALAMLLNWAKNDPVSQVEVDRNNAVYGIQGNRNPFVDYEGLEQHIWGDFSDQAVDFGNYTNPYNRTDATGNGGVESITSTAPTLATNLYQSVTTTEQLDAAITAEKKFIVVGSSLSDYAQQNYVMTSTLSSSYYNSVAFTPNTDNFIDVSLLQNVAIFNLAKNDNGYTLNFDGTSKYLESTAARSVSAATSSTTPTEGTSVWSIDFTDGTATIANTTTDYGSLRFNYNSGNSPRFTTYSSNVSNILQLAQLYVQTTNGTTLPATPTFSPTSGSNVTKGSTVTIATATSGATIYYSADGGTTYTAGTAGTSSATITLSTIGTATLTAYATQGGLNSGTATAIYTVTEPTHSYFQKITSTDDLEVGKRYLIVNEGNNKALGGRNSNYRTGATITIDNSIIDLENAPAAYPVTLDSTTGGYTFALTNDSLLAISGSNNTTLTTLMASSINNNARWTIEFDNGNAVIKSITSTSTIRAIRYNNTNARFGYYAASGENSVQLYKEVSNVTQPTSPTISPVTGSYTSAQTVNISAADGTNIYYTTDGSTPTMTSTAYTIPFTVSTTTTVKAIAVLNGISSEVTTSEITITQPASTGEEYERIYSTDDLVEGGKYLIVYRGTITNGSNSKSANVALGARSSYYREAIPVEIDTNNRIDLAQITGTKPTVLTITSITSTGKVTFKTDDATTGYLKIPSSNNNYLQTSSTEDGDNTKFIITFNDSIATIAGAAGDRTIGINISTEPISFRSYKTANPTSYITLDIQIFAKRRSSFNISKWGWGTYYDERAYTMPDDVTGMTIINGTGAQQDNPLTAGTTYTAGDIVPGKTALLLHGDGGANGIDYDFAFYYKQDKPAQYDGTSNLLHGSMEGVAAADMASACEVSADDHYFYKLTTKDDANVGFYWGADNGAPFQMKNGHKCWLVLPKTQSGAAHGFALDFEALISGAEVTTVSFSHEGSQTVPVIYDLQGCRVTNPSKGGIYIVNGKKIIFR